MRREALLSLVAAMLTLSVTVVCKAVDENKKAAVGQPAPAFKLEDQDGKKISLADQGGKIVVLEWFNEACPVVQRHYKDREMNTLANKWAGKGVVWLAINSTKNTSNETNKKAADAWKMGRPVLNDASGDVGHEYGATNTPHMYVIDASGKLAYAGAIDDDPQGEKSARTNYVDQALSALTSGASISTAQTKAYGCAVHYAK